MLLKVQLLVNIRLVDIRVTMKMLGDTGAVYEGIGNDSHSNSNKQRSRVPRNFFLFACRIFVGRVITFFINRMENCIAPLGIN